MSISLKYPWLLVVLCGLICGAMMNAGPFSLAHAAEVHYGTGYAAEYTTNIFRLPKNNQNEWTNISTAFFSAEDTGDRYNYELDGELEYRQYAQNSFPDEQLKTVEARSDIAVWRNNLSWTTQGYITPVRSSSKNPDTPVNRQETKVFTMGPDLSLQFGQINELYLNGRYVNTREEGRSDSLQNSTEAVVSRQISPAIEVSLRGEYVDQDVDEICINCDYLIRRGVFDPEFNGFVGYVPINSFIRKEASVSIERNWPRILVGLEAGLTRQKTLFRREVLQANGKIEEEIFNEESEEDLYALTGTYRLNSDSLILFNAAREAGNTTEAIIEGFSREVIDPVTGLEAGIEFPAQAIVSSGPYVDKSASIDWSHTNRNSDWVFGINTNRRDFLSESQESEDEKSRGSEIEFNYSVSDTMTFSCYGLWNRIAFASADQINHYAEYGLGLDFSLIRVLSLQFDIFRAMQNSTDENQEFRDNTILMAFTYQPTLAR